MHFYENFTKNQERHFNHLAILKSQFLFINSFVKFGLLQYFPLQEITIYFPSKYAKYLLILLLFNSNNSNNCLLLLMNTIYT